MFLTRQKFGTSSEFTVDEAAVYASLPKMCSIFSDINLFFRTHLLLASSRVLVRPPRRYCRPGYSGPCSVSWRLARCNPRLSRGFKVSPRRVQRLGVPSTIAERRGASEARQLDCSLESGYSSS